MEVIKKIGFAHNLYYSDDAVNMGGEYQGLWVRWRAIDKAINENTIEAVSADQIGEIEEQIYKLQSYKLYVGDTEKVDRKEVIDIINKYIMRE